MEKIENKNIRSFGRIRGKNLTENKIEKLENNLQNLKIELDDDFDGLSKNYKKVFLEIGFGQGEHTAHQAMLNPDCLVVSCETYINGVMSLVSRIEENKIENIKIYNNDARDLLEKLPDNYLDRVFILFPDPWPKKRQNKRRIINEEFLTLLKSKMKKGGTLFFASDIENYVEWTMEKIQGILTPTFNSVEECKNNQPVWWVETKYQKKAIREGRDSYFMEFINHKN